MDKVQIIAVHFEYGKRTGLEGMPMRDPVFIGPVETARRGKLQLLMDPKMYIRDMVVVDPSQPRNPFRCNPLSITGIKEWGSSKARVGAPQPYKKIELKFIEFADLATYNRECLELDRKKALMSSKEICQAQGKPFLSNDQVNERLRNAGLEVRDQIIQQRTSALQWRGSEIDF